MKFTIYLIFGLNFVAQTIRAQKKIIFTESVVQNTEEWCWAATLQMVVKNENLPFQQCDFIKFFGECDCENVISICNRTYNPDCKGRLFEADFSENKKLFRTDTTLQNIAKNFNFKIKYLSAKDSTLKIKDNLKDFSNIKSKIDNNKLIMASVNDLSHFVIIKGYEITKNSIKLFLIDPLKRGIVCKAATPIIDLNKNGKTINQESRLLFARIPSFYKFDAFFIVNN